MMTSVTIATRILQDFAFLCKLGLLLFKVSGITKLKHERKNLKNSGRSNKMTASCKWPIALCYEKLYCVTFKRDILEASREFVVCLF